MTAPATYGDVTGEYLALRNGAGVIADACDVVWVRGPDTVSFLDGLLSQDLAAMTPGAAARSLLLAPQGKLRATLWVLMGTDEVGLVADPGRGEIVAGDLGRFKIRVDATIEAEHRPTVAVWGPEAGSILAAAGLEVPDTATWRRSSGGTVVADLPLRLVDRFRLVTIGADAEELVAAGGVKAGRLAATTLRIEVGEPRVGVDLDDGTIPQEGNVVEGAVSFTKGCYLGQELVARIDSRGRVNRHLRGVVVTTNVLPPVGAEVVVDDQAMGAVTSVGESLELRAPVAMGLIRREVDPGSEVELRWEGGRAPAVVHELPLLDH